MLVTTDTDAYTKLHALHGAPMETFDPTHSQGALVMSWGNEYYSAAATWHKMPFKWVSNLGEFEDEYSRYYSADAYNLFWPGGDISGEAWLAQRFTNLAGIFHANAPYYSAEVPSERVESELLSNSEYLGGKKVAGRYSESLFSNNVDPGRTRGYNKQTIELKKNEKLIWSDAVEEEHLWGLGNELIKNEESITVQKGITVTENDLDGSDLEIAQKLFIAEEDVADLKNEFNKAQKAEGGERLVLLRYATTNYHSAKAIVKISDVSDSDEEDKDNDLIHTWMDEYHNDRLNGYLCQETVFLDFDVISMWFATENAETEIPVMMTPQDVLSGLQPGVAPNPSSSNSGFDVGKLILAVLSIVLLVVIVLFIVSFFKKKNKAKSQSHVDINVRTNPSHQNKKE